MKKSFLVVMMPALLVFLAITACGGGSAEQVLVFARPSDSVGLDPARETDTESFMVINEIAEALVRFTPETTEVEPGLAESWDISDDGLTYTFALRKGVVFHDGTPFNAAAVIVNYTRQFDENNPYYQYGPYKYWGYMNLAEFVKSVEAVDEYTVRFALNKPNAPFLSTLAMSFAGILSPAAMEQYKADLTNHPVGTGPFKFVSWIKGDAITLERNEDYWGKKGKLSRVIFKVIPEATARALALEKGEVDIIINPSPQDIERLEANKEISIYRKPGLNVIYMAFNTQKKPFNDVRVRRALSYALNKQEFIDAVYGPLGRIAYSAIPPAMWSYTEDIATYEYNPQKAKQLLAEAGYPNGFSFTLWASARMVNGGRAAEIVQAHFGAVGVTASIEMLDWGAHLDGTDAGRHEVAFLGWQGDNGDPDNFLGTLLSAHTAVVPASNIAFWKNAEFTTLTDEAVVISDQDARTVLYQKAQKIFADQAPWIPLAHSVQAVPMRSAVKGYKGTPVSSFYNLSLVSIEK